MECSLISEIIDPTMWGASLIAKLAKQTHAKTLFKTMPYTMCSIIDKKGKSKRIKNFFQVLCITTVYSPRPGTRFHKQNTLHFNNKYTRFSFFNNSQTLKTQRSYQKQQRYQPKTSTPIQRTKWRYRHMTTMSTLYSNREQSTGQSVKTKHIAKC